MNEEMSVAIILNLRPNLSLTQDKLLDERNIY